VSASLHGKTLVVSGASRGIGLAIALRAAADGANIVLIAKTTRAHPKLTGTIYTAADAINAAGGRALPIAGDLRSDETINEAVAAAVDTFGGIDVCVNNASVLSLAGTLDLAPRRYDLMQDVNTRATFMLTRACLPYLLAADNPHVLTLSPPLNLRPRWLGAHPGYMLAKYGMTLATLGIAAEFADSGIAANCLWPLTLVATDAVGNLLGGPTALARARKPDIIADAAHAVLVTPSRQRTGQALIDEDVLREHGVTDLHRYAMSDGAETFETDLFVD
jgi:citronellol/citronellal dehydrogenase